MSQETNTKLQEKIEDILDQHPEARNSDRKLQALLWYKYYPHLLVKQHTSVDLFNGTTQYLAPVLVTEINGTPVVSDEFMELPLGETVKRHRAHIQNTLKMYLPTSLEVAKTRRIKEADVREYYGDRGVTY